MNPSDLPSEWRSEAEHLRKYGVTEAAQTLEYCATELEEAWRIWLTEPLTVAEAATETGYSEDHLRQLVRDGKLPDGRPLGSQGQILLRRCDLPRKARWERTGTPAEELAEAVLASRH